MIMGGGGRGGHGGLLRQEIAGGKAVFGGELWYLPYSSVRLG
jgi:hypothetical protein